MIRPGHLSSLCRLGIGSIQQLDNWREMLAATVREVRGKAPRDAKVMRFRDGLEIGLAPGGMGGFYILFREIFCEGCYEPVGSFRPTPSATVVDLGANMGVFACRAAKLAPRGRVIAVEPLSCYTAVLRNNIRRNALENVSLWPAAMSREPGRTSLSYWYTATGEPKCTPEIPPSAPRAIETVDTVTLQQIFEREQIEQCDLLKIDIEGAEYQALLWTPASVLRKIHRIAMEWHKVAGHHPKELLEFLETNGFEILGRSDRDWEKDTGMLYAVRR